MWLSDYQEMKSKLENIYQKLYSYFGPQHWWPAKTPFEVMVGAVLTQNTNWQNVERAIDNLKQNKLLSPDKLYKLSQKRLAYLIKPAGYYNIKAKRLKKFLSFLFKHYQANLKNLCLQDTQKLRNELLSVNGIGCETADSMLLYALEKPVFVVDAYTKRVLLRHRFIKEDATYAQIQNLFMQNLYPVRNTKAINVEDKISNGVKLFNEYHALLVKLGKEFCLKNKPRCNVCPLK